MVTKTKVRRKRKVADSYFDLVVELPLASIKSQAHLEVAQQMIDRLITKGGEELYLDALSDLVAAFEDVHYALAPASDAEMLRHLMDAKEVTQAELHRRSGIPKSSISEVLAGKKQLSRGMIRTLAEVFNADSSVLAALRP